MTKELTDKTIPEIVESQIDSIKKINGTNFFDYKVLRNYLTAGLKKHVLKNEEPDYKRLKELEKIHGSGRYIRLLNVIKTHNIFSESQDRILKNKHLLEFYKLAEEKGLRIIPNYWLKTHEFLRAYLVENDLSPK